MQFISRIDAIEGRAKALGLSLHGLCDEAGAEYSTIHRWRKGEMSPNVATLERHLAPLERFLKGKETALRRALARRRDRSRLPA